MAMVHRNLFHLDLTKRALLFMGMLSVTLLTGLICRRTGVSWIPGMALQGAVGLVWSLCFRMIEPLKGIRLIAEKP